MKVRVNAVDNLAYIDNNGNAVRVTLDMAVIHELSHALTGRTDIYNIATPDYNGPNDIFVNKIYDELGFPDRNSYISAGPTTLLTPGYAYTNGAAIDDSVLVWKLPFAAARCSPEGCLYLNFQADFDDLGGRYPEVCGWKIGIKVHRGKQGLSPARHACCHAAWDHHYPPKIVGDSPRIDAA
jgi:hypothetical protein